MSKRTSHAASGRRSRGFSIVELVVGMAVLGVLVGMGAPSMREWLANAALRSVAESITGGLQMARSEAMRRNTTVTFRVLDQGDVLWEVVDGSNTRLHFAARASSGNAAAVTVSGFINAGVTADWVKGAAFNGMGRAVAVSYGPGGNEVWDSNIGESVGFRVDLPASVLPPASTRDFRIDVQRWGAVRMCDPNLRPGLSQACAGSV